MSLGPSSLIGAEKACIAVPKRLYVKASLSSKQTGLSRVADKTCLQLRVPANYKLVTSSMFATRQRLLNRTGCRFNFKMHELKGRADLTCK